MEKAGKDKEALDQQFAEITPPTLVPVGGYIMTKFLEISAARSNGQNGPLPINYTELKAYADLSDDEFEPWEVDAIRLLDAAFIDEFSKLLNKETTQ